MVQLVVFVNLFFVPAIALYMIYWKKNKPLQVKLDLLFQYCTVAACNIPLTKIFVFIIKKASGAFISIDSGYYTLAALLSAFLLYRLYMYQASETNRRYWVKQYIYYKTYWKEKRWIEIIRQRGAKRIRNELMPAYFLVFVSCFMMLVFEPILLYATNITDFWFDFWIMIGPLLGAFLCFLLGGLLIVSLIYFVNLFFSGRMLLFKGLTLAGFMVFFLLYVQGNWLSGNLPPLTGEPIVWESYGRFENRILLIILAFLSIAAAVGIRKLKLDRTIRYAAVGGGVISVMLAVSLIPTVVENNALKAKNTFTPTTENYNTVSSNQNFLIFLVDHTDSKRFYEVMENDEDFYGMFEDFTYYPDTLSVFAYTINSIPNILTGTVNHNETGFLDYSSSAYNQSPFFDKLMQNGYGINLYSSSIAWGGHRNFEIENTVSIYDTKVDFADFMNQELKYIRFKYLPYGMKQGSQIETLDFNACRMSQKQIEYYSWSNRVNHHTIRINNVLEQREKNCFQFVHVEGAHLNYDMDKYLNLIEGGTEKEKIAATLTLIKTYLQRLKENDAYDNSVIVIMADHGSNAQEGAGELLYEDPYWCLDRCNPVLLMKGYGEKHKMIKSDKPVSYMDLQDAFCGLVDGKHSSELFAELRQGRVRTALYEYGRSMVEYETTGKAWELEKFVPTGKVYDLEQ